MKMEKCVIAYWSVALIVSIIILFSRCMISSVNQEKEANKRETKNKEENSKKKDNREEKRNVTATPQHLLTLFTTQIRILTQQNRGLQTLKLSLQKEYDIFSTLCADLTDLLDRCSVQNDDSSEIHRSSLSSQIHQNRQRCYKLLNAQKEVTSLLANSSVIHDKFSNSGKNLVAELQKIYIIYQRHLNSRNNARDGIIKILINDNYYEKISSNFLRSVVSQLMTKGLHDAESRLQEALREKNEYEATFVLEMNPIIQTIVHTTTYNSMAVSKELRDLDSKACIAQDESNQSLTPSISQPSSTTSSSTSSSNSLSSTFSLNLAHQESCGWLNLLISRIHQEMTVSRTFNDRCCQAIHNFILEQKIPTLKTFKVSIEFGSSPPELSRIQHLQTYVSENYDIFCSADLLLPSIVSTVTVIIFDVPLHTTDNPLSIKVQLNNIVGRIKFGINKNFFTISFFSMPDLRNTRVHTNFPWWVPGISEYVMYRLRRVLRNRLVHPNQRTFQFWKPQTL